MLISLITVNLNNCSGLIRTIESIVKQRFNNYEYIVIDGNSSDGSIDVIKQYDNIITKYIIEFDSGIYEAMNKGIFLASGEYILFVNSGDFLVNENVLTEIFSKSHNADFLLGRCNVSKKGIVIHTTNPPKYLTFRYLYEAGLAHQSTLIKRELFEKYGFYREDFRYNADIEFWYRTIILNGCSTETLSTIIADYNLDGMSSKENKSENYIKEMEIIYSHPLLQLFIPDYEKFKKEQNDMQIMYWVKSKKWLYNINMLVYCLASKLNKCKI